MQGKGFISRGYASMDHNGQTDPVPTEVPSRNGGLGLRCMCRIDLSTVLHGLKQTSAHKQVAVERAWLVVWRVG